jgi:hypothetical protein
MLLADLVRARAGEPTVSLLANACAIIGSTLGSRLTGVVHEHTFSLACLRFGRVGDNHGWLAADEKHDKHPKGSHCLSGYHGSQPALAGRTASSRTKLGQYPVLEDANGEMG